MQGFQPLPKKKRIHWAVVLPTSSRASTGGATTVPRQSTSSLSSSRTSMDGMVPNAAARRRTTADDDRFLFTATTVDSLDGVSSSLCLPQKVSPCSNVQMARTGGRLQTSCRGRETPPSRGCIGTTEEATWFTPCGRLSHASRRSVVASLQR